MPRFARELTESHWAARVWSEFAGRVALSESFVVERGSDCPNATIAVAGLKAGDERLYVLALKAATLGGMPCAER